MGVFQAVTNGFKLITKNSKLWGLLIVINIALMLISIPILLAVFGPAALQPGATPPAPGDLGVVNWMLLGLAAILAMLLQVFINAGAVGTVKDIIKTGSLNLGKFLENAKKFFVRFLVFAAIMLLAMLAVLVVFMLLGALVGAIGNAVNILGILLGVILAVAVLAALILISVFESYGPIAIAVEDKPVFESIKKTLAFVKGKFWKATGLFFLMVVILLLGAGALFLIFVLVALIMSIGSPALSQGAQTAIDVISRVAGTVVNSYLTLVFIASIMSYYLDSAQDKVPSPPGPTQQV